MLFTELLEHLKEEYSILMNNLPKIKAEQYLRDVITRYRNKLVYDASKNEIRDDRNYMSMLEDFITS